MNRPARVLVAIPIVAGLGWVSAYAVEMGTAGTAVFDSSMTLDAWSASRMRPAPETLDGLKEDLVRAVRLAPSDPAAHELLGVVAARRLNRAEYLPEAGVHFVKALSLRPTSPYTWANLAAQRYGVGSTGPDFEAALVNASSLGPFELEVQRTVAYFGLAVWHEVAPKTREAIDVMVAHGMKRNPMEMLQIAGRRGRLDVACHHLAGSPRQTDSKWSQLCQSTEATS
jgi:hypothetical protein